MAAGGGPGHRAAGAPDRRGRHGRGQELRLPRAGDPGRRRAEEEGRRLDAHDRAPGAVASQGHPVPALGDAAGVLGGAGQGAVELHQPAAARCRGGSSRRDLPEGTRRSTSSARCGSGPNRTTDGSRSDLDFRPLPSVWDAVAERGRQLPRPRVPAAQGVLLLQGPAADVVGQHAGRQPRAVRHRPGTAGCGLGHACPSTTWRSSTRRTRSRPSPASTWGCRSRTIGVDITLARLYNDRSGKGLLSFHRLQRGDGPGPECPHGRRRFLRAVADWHRARSGLQRPGPAARSTGPTPSARSCASSLRPSARGRPRSRSPSTGSS